MMLIIINIETVSLDNENGMIDDDDKKIKRRKIYSIQRKEELLDEEDLCQAQEFKKAIQGKIHDNEDDNNDNEDDIGPMPRIELK